VPHQRPAIPRPPCPSPRFKDEREAACAYDRAATLLLGPNATLNFPEEVDADGGAGLLHTAIIIQQALGPDAPPAVVDAAQRGGRGGRGSSGAEPPPAFGKPRPVGRSYTGRAAGGAAAAATSAALAAPPLPLPDAGSQLPLLMLQQLLLQRQQQQLRQASVSVLLSRLTTGADGAATDGGADDAPAEPQDGAAQPLLPGVPCLLTSGPNGIGSAAAHPLLASLLLQGAGGALPLPAAAAGSATPSPVVPGGGAAASDAKLAPIEPLNLGAVKPEPAAFGEHETAASGHASPSASVDTRISAGGNAAAALAAAALAGAAAGAAGSPRRSSADGSGGQGSSGGGGGEPATAVAAPLDLGSLSRLLAGDPSAMLQYLQQSAADVAAMSCGLPLIAPLGCADAGLASDEPESEALAASGGNDAHASEEIEAAAELLAMRFHGRKRPSPEPAAPGDDAAGPAALQRRRVGPAAAGAPIAAAAAAWPQPVSALALLAAAGFGAGAGGADGAAATLLPGVAGALPLLQRAGLLGTGWRA
jgi:hypothetical protein